MRRCCLIPFVLLFLSALFLTPAQASTVRTYRVKSASCGYVHQPMGNYIENGDIWVGDPVLQGPKRGWMDIEYDGFFANGGYTIEKVELVLTVKDAASSGSSFVFTSYQGDIYDLGNPLDAGDMSLTPAKLTALELWNVIPAGQVLAVASAGMPLGEVRVEFGTHYFLNYDRGTIPLGIYEDGDDGDEVYYWGTGDLAPRLEVTYSPASSAGSGAGGLASVLALLLEEDAVAGGSVLRSLSAGSVHWGAVTENGTLYTWGENDGRIGDGTTTDRNVPTRIGQAGEWASVSCGDRHTAAIKTDGSLWTWGVNWDYALGDGTTTRRLSPVRIGDSNNWQSVHAGISCTFGVMKDGSLWAWGANLNGQLGNGSTETVPTPVRIGNDTNWERVGNKMGLTLGLKTDGSLYVWGYNGYLVGMGDGTYAPKSVPTRLGTDSDWKSFALGAGFNFVIKIDGSLYGWGENSDRQLGLGTTSDEMTLLRIGTDADWDAVAAGNGYTLALKQDGTLWEWGSDMYWSTGNNTPVAIGNSHDLRALSLGFSHALGATADGILYEREGASGFVAVSYGE